MAFVRRQVVDITTDGAGAGTGYTADPVNGFVHAIVYAKDGSNAYSNGVGATITGESSGIAVLATTNMNASATYHPRAATVDTANAALLYAAGGTAVGTRIPVADERVKIVIAAGGATKAGRFYVYVGG